MSYTAKQLAQSYKDKSKQGLAEMILLGKVLSLNSTKKLFGNPKISIDQKKKIINDVFTNYFSQNTINFVNLLIGENALNNFADILNEYRKILRVDKIALSGTITSANAFSDEEIRLTEKNLETKMSIPIVLQSIVKPELLGGIILEIDGQVYNNSFSHKLNKLKV